MVSYPRSCFGGSESIVGCYSGYFGLQPRRKSRTLFLLGLRLFLILRMSGSDEGFAEKFGWLSRSCLDGGV